MNGAFLHIALNHIPVLGVPFGLLILLGGLTKGGRDLLRAGLWTWVVVALITIPVIKSGGPAAHVIKDLPGIVRGVIHAHAEAADTGFWATEILGALSLIGLWLSRRGNNVPKLLAVLLVLGGVGVSGWMAWVAHLGGLIRHPEIAGDYVPANPAKAFPGPADTNTLHPTKSVPH